MDFNLLINSTPFPYLFFSALFFGAALNRGTRFMRKERYRFDPEKARTVKWVFFSLYLSLSLVFALGAVFIPGPDKIGDIRHLYFFLGCALFFFLVFKFKKTMGVLALFLFIALLVAVLLFLQSITAFTGETEIARIRVITVQTDLQGSREEQMKLEIIPAMGEPVIIGLAGSYFAPVVLVIIFEDYLVFMGVKTWYRFEGLTSFIWEKQGSERVLRQQETDFYFSHPLGISERLWAFFEQHETRIPGVRTVQVDIAVKRARELSTYSVRVQNDGGVQIIELN